jgi:hypothetical protein
MNPLMRKLYTEEEIREKIEKYKEEHEGLKAGEYHVLMISATYALALLFEILQNDEYYKYHLEKVIKEWNLHPGKHFHWAYINALEKLGKAEKALEEILSAPRSFGIETLAYACREVGKKNESILLFSGLAVHAFELSETRSSFWRPHYLQKASNLWERAECKEWADSYNMRALQTWNEVKDSLERKLCLIEEAWLHEEVAYIHERAQRFDEALRYYEKAQVEYETAHKKEPTSVQANHCDGDWNRYYGFFSLQIPDLSYIDLPLDSYEENDLRRMKYRFLTLKQKRKSLI